MGELAGLVAASGFASGLSLYATALLLGLAGRYLDGVPVPDELTTTPLLVVVGVLTAAEFVVDKVPWLDSAWDAVHTVVRPAGAAWLGLVLAEGMPLSSDLAALAEGATGDGGGVAAAITAGLLATVAHAAKASTRVAVNSSPEPFSNPTVSLLEDGLVGVLVWVAIEHPMVALAVVAVLTLLSLAVIVGLWRLVRRVLRARRRRRATTH